MVWQVLTHIGLMQISCYNNNNNNNNNKRQFIRRSNMARVTTRALLVLWKQLVSEVGTREQMCLEHVFES